MFIIIIIIIDVCVCDIYHPNMIDSSDPFFVLACSHQPQRLHHRQHRRRSARWVVAATIGVAQVQ